MSPHERVGTGVAVLVEESVCVVVLDDDWLELFDVPAEVDVEEAGADEEDRFSGGALPKIDPAIRSSTSAELMLAMIGCRRAHPTDRGYFILRAEIKVATASLSSGVTLLRDTHDQL